MKSVSICLLVIFLAKSASAQFAGYAEFCGLPTFVQPEPGIAAATIDPNHGRIIIVDPSAMANVTASRKFAIAHECAHHKLGHVSPRGMWARSNGATARQELAADCWAAKALASAGYRKDIKRTVQQNRLEGPYMQGGYPSGVSRARVILKCLGR